MFRISFVILSVFLLLDLEAINSENCIPDSIEK